MTVGEALGRQVLHDQPGRAVLVDDVEDGDRVRVVQLGGDAALAHDAQPASSASAADRPGWSSSCLTATVRFSRSSCACQTMPIAPVPMRLPNR